MKFLNDHTSILYGERPTDRSDPDNGRTAVELALPDNFSDKAKRCWEYYDGAAYIFEYREKLYVTDESLELATDGDGTPEKPFGGPRWICSTWAELEKALEQNFDELAEDDMLGEFQPTADERHIMSLNCNGARITSKDGLSRPVSLEFYHAAVAYCKVFGYNAVTYSIELPGIDGDFSLAIWQNGHADSGTTERIMALLDR